MTEERQAEWRNRRMGDIQVGLILNRDRKENPMTLRFYSRPDEPWKARVLQSIVDEANATGAFFVRRTSMGDKHEIHIYCDAASANKADEENSAGAVGAAEQEAWRKYDAAQKDRATLELEEEWFETRRTYASLLTTDVRKSKPRRTARP